MNDAMMWLDKISNSEASVEDVKKGLEEQGEEKEPVKVKKNLLGKMLKIQIVSNDGDKVNVQVPVKLAKLLPAFKTKLQNKNVFADADVDIEEIIEMIEQGLEGELVNIESKDGDRVRIVVE